MGERKWYWSLCRGLSQQGMGETETFPGRASQRKVDVSFRRRTGIGVVMLWSNACTHTRIVEKDDCSLLPQGRRDRLLEVVEKWILAGVRN